MKQRTIELGLLLVIAAVVLWDGAHVVTQGESSRAGLAGGYESLLGVLLACLAVLYWVRAGRVGADPPTDWKAEQGLRWVVIGGGILLAYILAMPFLGYTLSTILAFAAYMRIYSPYRWLPVVGASCLIGISTAWLWSSLAILLPEGFIPWP